MNKLYLVIAFLVAPAFAARAHPEVEVCLVAQVEQVEGAWVPRRGVRIYQQPDGSFRGVLIKEGSEQSTFGGSQDFTDALRSALDNIPADIADWNVEFDSTLKREFDRGSIPVILDGWMMELRVTTPRASVQLMRFNAGSYVVHLGERSEPFARLKRLLDTIALELGREQMVM